MRLGLRLAWASVLLGAIWVGDVIAAPLPLPPSIVPAPIENAGGARLLKLDRLVFRLRDGQVWGTSGTWLFCDVAPRSLYWKAEEQDWDLSRFSAILNEEAARLGLPIEGDNLFEASRPADSLLLGAAVDNVETRLCVLEPADRAYSFRGEMILAIEWQIYDPLQRRLVSRVKTRAGFRLHLGYEDGIDRLLHGAFRENALALLADDDFRQQVLTDPGTPHSVAQQWPPLRLTASGVQPRPPAAAAQSAVSVLSDAGHGSGFLVSSNGEILTNAHVVGRSKYVKVRWTDGTEALGEVVRSDPRRDVALIKIAPPEGRAPLRLEQSPPQAGEDVYAVGTPLDEAFEGTITRGIVSATRVTDGLRFIQSDVTVNPGNSGGPLVNSRGQVIAITVASFQPGRTPTGINLFIPIADALSALNIQVRD
ncbi:MAG: trypsin-like peptidase domain-containing protein [Phenylobacterium sp.]|uniref:S1C family serine protease n=1 Tax=Phenylobacterium sp. TaxID=1871053 RepID=UPI002717EDFD|nr:trypsin-like peptidase domain-containing protein [Phenylobacterium sp.]MDO8902812.1 trypsin-like peptidase domain-containing protein [Phenylobacterium sp.]